MHLCGCVSENRKVIFFFFFEAAVCVCLCMHMCWSSLLEKYKHSHSLTEPSGSRQRKQCISMRIIQHLGSFWVGGCPVETMFQVCASVCKFSLLLLSSPFPH